MTIEIKGKEQTLTSKELKELFLSVEWSSGHYPDKLETAMRNYQTVFNPLSSRPSGIPRQWHRCATNRKDKGEIQGLPAYCARGLH